MVKIDLFSQVLDNKDLSKAGDLFSLDDDLIADDLSDVLSKIQQICEEPDYVTNDNNQSVVEICITRVTTAIRETNSIEKHTPALISLLETCLNFNLEPSSKDDDPPHSKIASDVMMCLFVHYSRRRVMEATLPVVVKFLSCRNKEIGRNVSSYLSLAAIDNSDLLSEYRVALMQSIIDGNTYLMRVLPQLYKTSREILEQKVGDLISLLVSCDMPEKNSLLELFTFISKDKPEVLVPHVKTICEYLSPTVLVPLTLRVLADVSVNNSDALEPYVLLIQQAGETHVAYMGLVSHIIGHIGSVNEDHARNAVTYLMKQVPFVDPALQPAVFQEVLSLVVQYPKIYGTISGSLDEAESTSSSSCRHVIQQIRESQTTVETEPEMKSVSSQTDDNIAAIAAKDGELSTYRPDPQPRVKPNDDSNIGDKNSSSHKKSVGCMVTEKIQDLVYNNSNGEGVAAHMDNSQLKQRDVLQQFCDKHLSKICVYIEGLKKDLPLPKKCHVINGKHKRYVRLSFQCCVQAGNCIYSSASFTMTTKLPNVWLHLMFLGLQASSSTGLGQNCPAVKSLKSCLSALTSDFTSANFLTLMTSAFPSDRDKQNLLQELNDERFFDVFEFYAEKQEFACFICHHPEKVTDLLQDGTPTISGQLKEKKGRWKFLKRWKTRYFTLSGSQITYNKSDTKKESLPISKIQSVKSVKRKSRDTLKAFEIFTRDQTYIFKAKDEQNAEQWLHCLQIAMAQSNSKSAAVASTDHLQQT